MPAASPCGSGDNVDLPVRRWPECMGLEPRATGTSIAQVDLGRRTHRHRRHDTLGPMAVQVIAAVEARLGWRTPDRRPDPITLVQFDRTTTGFVPREQHPDTGERPPARSVRSYRDDPDDGTLGWGPR